MDLSSKGKELGSKLMSPLTVAISLEELEKENGVGVIACPDKQWQRDDHIEMPNTFEN